jgi:hypothetical protein
LIDADNIRDSYVLMEHFVSHFEKLYRIEHMTYNIHLQLHLPTQVARFGPLFRNAVFYLEGYYEFKNNLVI